MIFTGTSMPQLHSSIFDALEADFDYQRKQKPREIYHRTMGFSSSDDPKKRYWPRILCSCVQQVPNSPGGRGQHRCSETPRKSSSYPDSNTRRPSLMRFSPEKRKLDPSPPEKAKSCPPELTTTIEESHDPDLLSDDEDSLDAILLDDQENLEPPEVSKRPRIDDKFAAHLNLEHFQPSEIQVRVLEDPARCSKRTLEVRARHQAGPHPQHDQSDDDEEYECLEYVKRLSLPGGVAVDDLRCHLDSTTGHLVIEAPLGTEKAEVQLVQRIIPVEVQRDDPNDPKQSLDSDLIIID